MSEPNSVKGTLFKEKLNAVAIKYRDCPPENLVVSVCLNRINEYLKDDKNIVLIGSSLGGLLAAKTAIVNPYVKYLILLNPAIIPPFVDISKVQGLPHRILVEMKDRRLFKQRLESKIFILVGTMDDSVPNSWPIEFAKSQEAVVRFLQDDHSFTQNMSRLPGIIIDVLEEKH